MFFDTSLVFVLINDERSVEEYMVWFILLVLVWSNLFCLFRLALFGVFV